MKRVEIVRINWNDLKSIKGAERKKTRLENSGYSLMKTTVGLNRSELLYEYKSLIY